MSQRRGSTVFYLSHLFICLSVRLSICPSVRLSVCLSVCLPVCLSCQSVCVSVVGLYRPTKMEYGLTWISTITQMARRLVPLTHKQRTRHSSELGCLLTIGNSCYSSESRLWQSECPVQPWDVFLKANPAHVCRSDFSLRTRLASGFPKRLGIGTIWKTLSGRIGSCSFGNHVTS